MINKLHLQATAYLFSKEVSTDLLEQLHDHQYNDLTDVVKQIVNEELESWQYCYVQNNPENESIPEYIVNTVSRDTVESVIQELLEETTPTLRSDTPTSRDKRLVEATGGRDEYCEQQIEWYTEACVRTLTPTIVGLLEEYSDSEFDQEDIDPIAEKIVSEFGLWRWYLLTRQSREKDTDKEAAEIVNTRVLNELDTYLLSLLQEYGLDGEVDLLELQKNL